MFGLQIMSPLLYFKGELYIQQEIILHTVQGGLLPLSLICLRLMNKRDYDHIMKEIGVYHY